MVDAGNGRGRHGHLERRWHDRAVPPLAGPPCPDQTRRRGRPGHQQRRHLPRAGPHRARVPLRRRAARPPAVACRAASAAARRDAPDAAGAEPAEPVLRAPRDSRVGGVAQRHEAAAGSVRQGGAAEGRDTADPGRRGRGAVGCVERGRGQGVEAFRDRCLLQRSISAPSDDGLAVRGPSDRLAGRCVCFVHPAGHLSRADGRVYAPRKERHPRTEALDAARQIPIFGS